MKIGIIGYGRFGQLWAEILQKIGHTVLVYDNFKTIPKKLSATLADVAKAEILFLLVPISEIDNCCQQISPLLSPTTLVVDACSVKEYPVQVMSHCLPKNQPIIATHPLFGPDSVAKMGIAGQKIVVCPVRADEKCQKTLLNLLEKLKLKIILTTPAEHDKQMANSQALVHFIGRGLKDFNLAAQEISTPNYQVLLSMIDMVNNDTDQLFYDMQERSRYAGDMRRKFLRNLQTIEAALHYQGEKITDLRLEVDHLDKEIMEKIMERMRLARHIGEIKKTSATKVLDAKREEAMKARRKKLCQQFNLNNDMVEKIFGLLMAESRRTQSS